MALDFQKIQLDFAAHLRNPETNAGPADVEARRMRIYSELFYNNVEGFISRGFPVLRKLYSDERWHRLVRDFFEHHQSQSPYFLEIGEEFLAFLQSERDLSLDPPFIVELAHYEWVELALDIATEEIPKTGFNPKGNLLGGRPAISPVAWVLQYQWPVHKIGPDYQPQASDLEAGQATYLIIYRTRDFSIKFMEINAITARLFSILQENEGFTGMKAIEQLVEESGIDLQVLVDGGSEALNHLRELEIILGTSLKVV